MSVAKLPGKGRSSAQLVVSLAGPSTSAQGALWLENFAAGATASFTSKMILQPFDTTKTILQASKNVRGAYSNFVECMVNTARTRGTASLYRGLLASVAVSAPSSAVFFTAYEHIKRAVEKVAKDPKLNAGFLLPLAPAISSALGNCVSSIVRVPPEVIKQRVQAGQYRNVFEAISGVVKLQGLGGFYTGYSSMVARDIPYAAIQFSTFEALKRRRGRILARRGKSGAGGSSEPAKLTRPELMLSNLWMGAVSGAVASVLTAPIDVVKTRVMTQQAKNGVVLGMRATFVRMWAEEGIQAFGRGILPRVLYKVPASAVFLVCYESMKIIMRHARLAAEKRQDQRLQQRSLSASEVTQGIAPSGQLGVLKAQTADEEVPPLPHTQHGVLALASLSQVPVAVSERRQQ